MTTCDKIREKLPWYVNRSLSSDEMVQIAEHLTACSVCQAELASLVRLSHDVEGLFGRLPKAPSDLWNRVTKETHGRPLGSLNVGSFLLGFSLGANLKRGEMPIRGDLRVMGRRVRLFNTERSRENTGGTHE